MLRRIHLVRVQPAPELDVLDRLSASLASTLRVSCRVVVDQVDARFAYDSARGQFNSTAILAALAVLPASPGAILLGVTDGDLYVPVLTFVFGEAQMPGRASLVSLHRLRNEFYGLAPDPDLLRERLLKEALHELGHTQGLRHCDDWRCVMVRSHAVERLDVKSAQYCMSCAAHIGLRTRPVAFGGLF